MHIRPYANRILGLLLGAAVLAASSVAFADPPTRVARIGFVSGNASLSPAGEGDWVQATLNRPLTTGDRLWTDAGGRIELQVGGAVIRMGENASLTLLNLDDRIAQVQLDQGTLNVRVRQLGASQSVEVATPNLAFTARVAGSYRIDADASDDSTEVIVRSGRGEVYGERASYAVDSRQAYRFAGTGLRSYESIAAPRADEFERWGSERDRRAEASASARYVPRDMIGYEDLDANGAWRSEPGYGNVWTPARVSADWTPYRDGHWAWVDPWGWTWVDDAPWGFAVSHYGRWANFRGRWSWVPGPARSRAVYAPALVAFVGGSNFQISISSGNVGGVAWFPLGPRDVYRPSYPVSRGYFDNINRSNANVSNTTITNVYNNRNVTNITNVYVNQQVQGAVVAVPSTTFVQSQPVSRAAVRLSRENAARAPVTAVAAVAPVQQSVRGAAAAANGPPAAERARARERRAIVRNAPPAARPGFAAQQSELAAKPGTPLAPAASAALKPAAPVAPANVVVATPAQSAPPKALPPAKAPDGKPGGRDRRDDRRGDRGGKGDAASKSGQPAAPAAAPAAPQAAPAPVAPPAVAPPPQRDEKGGKGDRDRGGKGEPGSKGVPPATPPAPPAAPQATPAPPAVPVKPVPPQAAPAPAAPPSKGAPPTTPVAPPAVPQATPAAPAVPVKPAPAPVPPQVAPAPAKPPAVAAPPQRDEKGGKGDRDRDRDRGGKGEPGAKGDPPAKPAASPPAPVPAPVQVAPPKPQPVPVPPKPEPAAAPPKPAPAPPPVQAAPPKPAPPPTPAPPPPPVKPAPPPAPAPAPPPAPPKPAPAPEAKPAPVAPPPAPQAAPPKPRPDPDKGDKKDRAQKGEKGDKDDEKK